MVRVVPITAALLAEGLPPSLSETALYHADASHASFRKLEGLGVRAVPEEGVPDGATLLVPQGDGGPLNELVYVVDRLLGPGGCPWDQAQTHETLKQYLLEETYEVFDAIDSGDRDSLQEELGDLLLQPVVHAQMEKLCGAFDINAVAQGIVDKLIRRHPHVFGEQSVADADEVLRNWEAIKKTEKGDRKRSLLAGVPKGAAALLRAHDVSKRAVRVGFEWPDLDSVFAKLREEEAELREAIALGERDRIESEVGDLLFTVVNLSRWSGVEPEEALRKMVNRFVARFTRMEETAEKELTELSPDEWDALWNRAKADVG